MAEKTLIDECIHKALRELVQKISDEHDIKVNSFSVDWLDISTSAFKKRELP